MKSNIDRSFAGEKRERRITTIEGPVVTPFMAGVLLAADADEARTALDALATDAEPAVHAHVESDITPRWIYTVVATDVTNDTTTDADITGLTFTPVLNTKYEFEALLMVRTANAVNGPRPSLVWAPGLTDGVVQIELADAATTRLLAAGNISATVLLGASTLADATGSWPCHVRGIAWAGATPSGAVKLQLRSSAAATLVTVKAGSYLRYRTFS
jgi:hypothetical protein